MTEKSNRPRELAGSRGAGSLEAVGDSFGSRNTDPPDANQAPSELAGPKASAALCAAGRCIAMANHGVVPSGVALWARDGRWHTRIDGGLDPSPGSSIAAELLLTGAAARALRDDDDDLDIEAIKEFGLALVALQDKFGPALVAALPLIARHEPIIRAIADELMRHQRTGARCLRAHLRPVIEAAGAGGHHAGE